MFRMRVLGNQNVRACRIWSSLLSRVFYIRWGRDADLTYLKKNRISVRS